MVNINDRVIGRRIQATRLQRNLSQADLAARLDVSVSYVSRIERGKIRLNLERLIEVGLVLDISILDILRGSYDSTGTTPTPDENKHLKDRLMQLINTATPNALELMSELCESVYKRVN